VLLDLQFYVYVLQIVVCPFVLFLLAIVLFVLRFTDSDYLPLVSSNSSAMGKLQNVFLELGMEIVFFMNGHSDIEDSILMNAL